MTNKGVKIVNDQQYALGMIETYGYPALVAAADGAAKAADVKIVSFQGADAGLVTVYIIGDVASVKAAVAVGEEAAKKVGQLRHSHVIARPDHNVATFIQEIINKDSPEKPIELNNKVQESQELKELSSKTVSELRKLAQTFNDFPLSIQEINTAKKEQLITLLIQVKKGGDKE